MLNLIISKAKHILSPPDHLNALSSKTRIITSSVERNVGLSLIRKKDNRHGQFDTVPIGQLTVRKLGQGFVQMVELSPMFACERKSKLDSRYLSLNNRWFYRYHFT